MHFHVTFGSHAAFLGGTYGGKVHGCRLCAELMFGVVKFHIPRVQTEAPLGLQRPSSGAIFFSHHACHNFEVQMCEYTDQILAPQVDCKSLKLVTRSHHKKKIGSLSQIVLIQHGSTHCTCLNDLCLLRRGATVCSDLAARGNASQWVGGAKQQGGLRKTQPSRRSSHLDVWTSLHTNSTSYAL